MQPRAAFAALMAAGIAGTLILVTALAGAAADELSQSHSAFKARIVAVYRAGAAAGEMSASNGGQFSADDDIVGEADWSTLPGSTVVSADWFDSAGELIDSSGPGPARTVARDTVMRADDNSGPGWYAFDLERWSDGERVETLARAVVDLQ